MWMDDQKYNVLKIAKRMIKTNHNITGEQFTRNDDGLLDLSDEDKKIAWKSYYEKLLNKVFAWDTDSLSQVFTDSGVPHLMDKDMVRESLSTMKNGNAAGTSGHYIQDH